MTKESVKVRFPRHTPQHGEDWIIDPSFLLRIYHSIDPDAHYGFIPTMEEIETALLALEVIPSKLYTAPPQQPEPPCKTGSQCVGGKCERCAVQEPWGYISHRSWKMPVFVEAGDLEVSGLPFNNPNYTPVYKAPPQREWQGLTDEEYNAIRYGHDENGEPYVDYELFEEGEYGMEVNIYVDDFARAIEAKLKEKNA